MRSPQASKDYTNPNDTATQIGILQTDIAQLNSLLTDLQTQVNAIQAKTDMMPTAAVDPLDLGVVPTLLNIIGADGVQADTRAKVNELIEALKGAGVLP